jgi:hypothetical protein
VVNKPRVFVYSEFRIQIDAANDVFRQMIRNTAWQRASLCRSLSTARDLIGCTLQLGI